MKKIFGIALVLALALSMCFGGTVLADSPTEVDISWSGSGFVNTEVDTGDAYAGFGTGGDDISGSYSAIDSNNNPYGYGVDSFSAFFMGSVENGFMGAGCDRLDSYVPMYGSAGQISYSTVWVEDGTASMAYRTSTNFAAQKDCSYKYQLLGGHNIIADASFYELKRYVEAGDGDNAYVYADGNGQATLDCMNAEMSAGKVRLGRGCGCYTDANFNATGTGGYFEVSGTGGNAVSLDGMGISTGGGTLQFIANWVGSISVADYSVSAW